MRTFVQVILGILVLIGAFVTLCIESSYDANSAIQEIALFAKAMPWTLIPYCLFQLVK